MKTKLFRENAQLNPAAIQIQAFTARLLTLSKKGSTPRPPRSHCQLFPRRIHACILIIPRGIFQCVRQLLTPEMSCLLTPLNQLVSEEPTGYVKTAKIESMRGHR